MIRRRADRLGFAGRFRLQVFGEFMLTAINPTAMGGAALFDWIELQRTLDH